MVAQEGRAAATVYAQRQYGPRGRAWAEWHMADGKMHMVACFVGRVCGYIGKDEDDALAQGNYWEPLREGKTWAEVIA